MGKVVNLSEFRRNKPEPTTPVVQHYACALCKKWAPVKKMHGPVHGKYFCSVSHRNEFMSGS